MHAHLFLDVDAHSWVNSCALCLETKLQNNKALWAAASVAYASFSNILSVETSDFIIVIVHPAARNKPS